MNLITAIGVSLIM